MYLFINNSRNKIINTKNEKKMIINKLIKQLNKLVNRRKTR